MADITPPQMVNGNGPPRGVDERRLRPALAVVVVNYRTAPLVIRCLETLSADPLLPPDTRIAVVDNGSEDGSAAQILAACARLDLLGRVTLFALPRNRGFAAGNNVAIAHELDRADAADAILLLNPDTLVTPGALARLVALLSEHSAAGIVGAATMYPDGVRQYASFRFPSPLAEFAEAIRCPPCSRLLGRWVIVHPHPEQARRTSWVTGAAMLVRRQVFEEVGLLDERYFLYFEEPDLSRRAARAGWETWTEPAARVFHLIGQATGAMGRGQSLVSRPLAWHRSRRLYFLRHHGRLGLVAADVGRLAGFALWKLLITWRRMEDSDAPDAYRAYWRESVFLRGFRV